MTKTTKIAAVSASVLVVLLVVAGALFFRGSWRCQSGKWTKLGHPLSRQPKTACLVPKPAVSNICTPPWSCGRLAQGEPGMKPNTWYLKYADVTGMARLEIVFDKGAQCHVNGAPADCAHLWPPSGAGVNFNGIKDGDLFRVSSLDITTKK
jgi:hypothetical protein